MPRPQLSTLLVLGALIAGLQTGCSSDPPAASEPSPVVPSTTDARLTSARSQLDRELIDAAWRNDVKRAQALIRDGADVNAKDPGEQSAFLIAASEGFLDLLELSLDSGADVASLDSYGGTALIRAAEAHPCGRTRSRRHRRAFPADQDQRRPRQSPGLDRLARGDLAGQGHNQLPGHGAIAGRRRSRFEDRRPNRWPDAAGDGSTTRFRDHRNHDSFGAGFTHRRWELGTPGRGQRREC